MRPGLRVSLAILLIATFLIRTIRLDQPIVENYVGRQIPTAMTTRNLGRGSGFLHPTLDTGPFPNYFLVEPPITGRLVLVSRALTGLSLEAAGRVVSAFGTTLAAFALYSIVVRREGTVVALLAVFVFATFPVSIKYGRSFQPDAFALGLAVSAIAAWDRLPTNRSPVYFSLCWGLTATAIAVRATSAYVCLPIGYLLWKRNSSIARSILTVASATTPCLLWYVWAAYLLSTDSSGSTASSDNAAIWLSILHPKTIVNSTTFAWIARYLLVTAFTPPGVALVVFGFSRLQSASESHDDKNLMFIWLASACAMFAVLAGKLHHEYYWITLAPCFAAGVARALTLIGSGGHWRRLLSAGTLIGLVLSSAWLSRSTWRTPDELGAILEAASEVKRIVPIDRLLIASEALLYYSDRKGCRLEWDGAASRRRAAGEWRAPAGRSFEEATSLVDFYAEESGATHFADLCDASEPREHHRLHEALRKDPRRRLIADGQGRFLIFELGTTRKDP